ncbi:hypothetical protein Lsed01_00949 [Demequina sediminis]|jgi:hypothetical protein|uniref:Uncharacterized protein n=1 Tax=Demequina sediminis TaxID=1930058 RepID=A0ABP9WIR3_9MICO
MKMTLILAAAVAAGAVLYVLVTENSHRDLWDDVHHPVR